MAFDLAALNSRVRSFVRFAVPALPFAFPANAWALCPMCRKALEEGNAGLIQGFYWSIILLVSLPLIVFIVVWRVYRRFSSIAKKASGPS